MLTETRFIDGKEQVCLVLPTQANQMKKGRQGNWLSVFRLSEREPNAKMITHDVQLGYLNWDETDKARQQGYYKRSQFLGRVRVHDRTPSKKVDRTNHGTDLTCDGVIMLSDIPRKLIKPNAENGKRYVSNLVFKTIGDASSIYTGAVCVDDIPKEHIQTNPETGKKYVNVRFVKTKYLDTYMNTHQLIIATDDGSELEIGKFKEWRRIDGKEVKPQAVDIDAEVHDTPVNQRQVPESIDGLRF